MLNCKLISNKSLINLRICQQKFLKIENKFPYFLNKYYLKRLRNTFVRNHFFNVNDIS